jgi:hypothetical protein
MPIYYKRQNFLALRVFYYERAFEKMSQRSLDKFISSNNSKFEFFYKTVMKLARKGTICSTVSY